MMKYLYQKIKTTNFPQGDKFIVKIEFGDLKKEFVSPQPIQFVWLKSDIAHKILLEILTNL